MVGFLSGSLLTMSACKYGPRVVTCISDPPEDGYQCYNQIEEKEFFLPYTESANYVCHPPRDYDKLTKWCLKGDKE